MNLGPGDAKGTHEADESIKNCKFQISHVWYGECEWVRGRMSVSLGDCEWVELYEKGSWMRRLGKWERVWESECEYMNERK